MKTSRAFWAGVGGAVIMTVLMAVGRALGMSVNLEMMLGSFVTQTVSASTWTVGLIFHLAIGGLIGLLYGWGFERATHRAGWAAGLALGATHSVISGLLLGLIPAMHPLMPQTMEPPGIFLANYGAAAVISFVLLHLVYGAFVGSAYAPVLHPAVRGGPVTQH